MTSISLIPLQPLSIPASETSSKSDFDFLIGKWNIHNKKLKLRLVNSNEWFEFDAKHEMRKVLAGIGNVENFYATIDGEPYEGMGVRLFDPLTRLWSIYWSDSNLGTMETPVVGSFDKQIGTFFCREMFKGNDIIMQFRFDATDPDKPVWSQAYSPDDGKTWEWNWFMYFSRDSSKSTLNENQNIKVIELRNYLIKPGNRERFIEYFEENFIQSQNVIGGYTLGQFRVKGADDNFFWIRGFHNMESRDQFLNGFYYGAHWKKYKNVANSMLANNDNVHLLKPLHFSSDTVDTEIGFNSNWFGQEKGIAVIDYYIANEKLDKLISFIETRYSPLLKAAAIKNISFWISEIAQNSFTALPVFQDKNLLVSIAFYKDELEYQSKMNQIENNIAGEVRNEMQDIVTIKTSLIIYPTNKSFTGLSKYLK